MKMIILIAILSAGCGGLASLATYEIAYKNITNKYLYLLKEYQDICNAVINALIDVGGGTDNDVETEEHN